MTFTELLFVVLLLIKILFLTKYNREFKHYEAPLPPTKLDGEEFTERAKAWIT